MSMEDIKAVAKAITISSDKKHYNSIIKLVGQYNDLTDIDENTFTDVEPTMRYLTMSLFQIFKTLFSREQLNPARAKNEKQKLFFQWCRKVYESFKSKLLQCISSFKFETSLALDCLDVFLQILELESIHFTSQVGAPFFPNKTLKSLTISLFNSHINDEIDIAKGQTTNPIVVEFFENYYRKYVDIQFYLQSELASICSDGLLAGNDQADLMAKWLLLMNHDNHYTSEEADLEVFVPQPPQAMENESKFKSNLEKNWLWFLNLDGLLGSQYKTTLLILHKRVIPHFQTPTKLMDFLTDSYNLGDGVTSILALNGLFELMKTYNLEYPNFYTKLYHLVTPELMHVKYRSRFMRLTDLFLSSTHVSANLIASFIKRFARLSLSSPPAAIVSIVPFIYNLIKKHPTCMIMLHDPDYIVDPFSSEDEAEKVRLLRKTYQDPFNIDEENPEHTHAIESSLWELDSLVNHYHPNVATLAKIFSQPFKKYSYNMEDFLDWSYDSLLNAEATRKLKVLPALEFEEFKEIFGGYLDGIEW